jgi:hypothetical protein
LSNGSLKITKIEWNGEAICTPYKIVKCSIRQMNKFCTNKYCCATERTGQKIGKTTCSWGKFKQCTTIIEKRCKMITLKNKCKRLKCCLYQSSELHPNSKLLKCHFKGPQICAKSVKTKCHRRTTRPSCTQLVCCTYLYHHKYVIKTSCRKKGPEKCKPIRFTKCSIQKLSPNCKAKKCCIYEKNGNVIKQISCKTGEKRCSCSRNCPKKRCDCPVEDNKIVCGDGKNYQNACLAKCSGASNVTIGKCNCFRK